MKIYTIYRAINLVNGKIYIGFDSNWPHRKYKHKSNSKNPKYNSYFYCAIRKYGFKNFKWDIIYQSYDYDHTLNKMENHFIVEYNSNIKDIGYNMTLGGEGTLGFVVKNKTKFYEFIDPNGNYVSGYNLTEFCKENNLSYEPMKLVLKGKRKSSCGYLNVNNPNYIPQNKRIYKIIDPSGNIIDINNLTEFCKMNNLQLSKISLVISNKRKSHKGYTTII